LKEIQNRPSKRAWVKKKVIQQRNQKRDKSAS
jgi:hypothetical protein